MSHAPILPGATLGIVGSGQLGRMLALAARQLGYRVHIYSPEPESPAGQVADAETVGAYADAAAVAQFARGVQALTFEFENIPSASIEAAAAHTVVRPDAGLLHTTQHRLREKLWLREHGIPTAEFRPVATLAELEAAVAELGCPCVLKTAGFGYDGKGQARIHEPADAPQAWERVGAAGGCPPAGEREEGQPPAAPTAIVERWVDFALECSVVGARGVGGEIELYDVAENIHAHHILDLSLVPARIDETTALRAHALARSILAALDVTGVLAVEMFLTLQGELLVNELAPRVHNSGHWSIEGAVASQFEQQVRAVCGLPLGSAALVQPAAMANLLGELWFDAAGQPREPEWPELLNYADVKLHLYGKREPRKGRKMGHITALAAHAEVALECVSAARQSLHSATAPWFP